MFLTTFNKTILGKFLLDIAPSIPVFGNVVGDVINDIGVAQQNKINRTSEGAASPVVSDAGTVSAAESWLEKHIALALLAMPIMVILSVLLIRKKR